MRKKNSWLWFYMIGLELAGQLACIFYKAGDMPQALVLGYIMEKWVFFFAVMLIAAFIKGRQGEKGNLFLLCATLFLEMLVLIAAAFLPVALKTEAGWEYLLICTGRIAYYIGIPGVAAIFTGLACSRIRRNHSGYVLAWGMVMSALLLLQGYEIYDVNGYNPCPIGNFFEFRHDTHYSMDEMLKGLAGQKCSYDEMSLMNRFQVREYYLELWVNQGDLFHAEACIIPMEEERQYSFRLNSFMKVTDVTDENGRKLSWSHENNVLIVYPDEGKGLQDGKITISFECQDETVLGIRGKYVSLPDYILYYPQPLEKETQYYVTVHSDGGVYSNLLTEADGKFAGKASSVSILGGSMTGEMYYKDCRIIYPKLLYRKEDVMKLYDWRLFRNQEEFQGIKTWFVDSFASLSYRNYYDEREMLDYDYVFCYD